MQMPSNVCVRHHGRLFVLVLRIACGLGLLVACDRAPDVAHSAPPDAGRLPAGLPALGTGAVLPSLEVAKNESSLWAKPLPAHKLEGPRNAFYARNFDATNIRMNPYTGHVAYAEFPTAPNEPALKTWQEEDLERRQLALFWRNADLMDLKERELRELQWTWATYDRCREGYGRRSRPEFSAMGPFAGKFKLRACFDQGGTVRSVEVAVWGPPAPMDTVPMLTKDDALAAVARQGSVIERRFQVQFVADRLALGDPRLWLLGDRKDDWRGEPEFVNTAIGMVQPALATWRLAWVVPMYNGHWDAYVDAKTGELFGMMKLVYY
jgi:hypothetical protein